MTAYVMQINGIKSLTRVLGVMAEAVGNPEPVYQAAIRPFAPPGFPHVLIRREFTLERSVQAAFDNEGLNAYHRNRWVGYEREPRYAAYKRARGGGEQVGVWEGSKAPLMNTFNDRTNMDHVETVDERGFEWGSKRYYARAFSEGGTPQPWDGIPQPAREIIAVNDAWALEIARGFQRYVVYKAKLAGLAPGDFNSLRIEP